MKKILWLSHEGDLGGANKCLAEQISILNQNKFDVSVIVIRKEEFVQEILKDVRNIYEIHFYSWATDLKNKFTVAFRLKRVLKNIIAICQIIRIIIKLRPDYVVTNTISIAVAAVAAKICFTPHVWFIHEFGEEDHGYQVFGGFKRGIRLINWLSAKIVFNSKAVQKKYAPYIPIKKMFISYNPVIIPGIEEIPISNTNYNPEASVLHCIMLGQIAPSKNHIEALKALVSIRDKYQLAINLHIVGKVVDPRYYKLLNDFILNNSLTDKVTISNYLIHPFDAIRNANVLLMCSRMEAFGRVTVEALKLGVPVIAANTGGSPEIVDHGINGYLYKAGNPESLAEMIKQLVDSYSSFDHKEISKKMNEKFNEEISEQQLLQVFS